MVQLFILYLIVILDITIVPEAQEKFAFVIPFGKFEIKKVPFGLVQTPTYTINP